MVAAAVEQVGVFSVSDVIPQCAVVRYCDYCEQAVVRIMQPRGERMVKGAEHGSGHGAGPGAGQNGVEQLGEGQSMETIVEAVQQAVKQVHC